MSHNSPASQRTALVLFGSETGSAQDVAEEIGRLLRRLRFAVRVVEMNAVSVDELLHHQVVLFSISTTGQGDLPGNARTFWKRIRSTRLQPGCLADVRFTSFGLGDTSYPKYNYAHRKLYNRLKQLGAQAFFERGESDEQHPEGLEGTLIPWITKLRQTLLDVYPLPEGGESIPDDVFLRPEWELQLLETNGAGGLHYRVNNVSSTPAMTLADHEKHGKAGGLDRTSATSRTNDSIAPPGTLRAVLTKNERFTPADHWQDVRLLEFETPAIDYQPGDVLTIFPHNDPAAVDKLIDIMHWHDIADKPVHFVSTSPESTSETVAPFAQSAQLTLRTLLLKHLDLNAIPRRSFFAFIAHFTDDEFQHDRLIEFTKPEYVDELFDYTTRPRRSIIEVLDEFDTVKLPWQWIADILPAIRGRQFSIASGGDLKRTIDGRGRIELLIAMVKYKTVIKKTREGLCSRYLSGLQPGAQLDVLLCKGGMQLAMNRPAMLVGPGTGIAPLRSMLFERAMHGAQDTAVSEHKQLLFFGGRNKSADFFFEQDWVKLQGQLEFEVHTAFSRDQSSKIYVQDVIKQEAAAVFDVLQTGNVYVCGSSGKMPTAVREALVEVFEKEGKISKELAEARLALMEKEGRYQQETW